ncbi:hypothetical protein [Algoriphagus yeomjeoni]|uniref:Uncharacterized protein n=1 Tax=Algoriphagus yeomjeoni TaxID=291403 RepID=A0A327PIJ0_9BACT|nr:hypothetical protein [Algoriphagus yeomjeoni]RAI91978.1 hypothetical protein LV83_01204 [Algoriphagus yeomjeoni]
MFSVRFTIALLLILMIPFILRTLSYRLEPYPALLFPGGEGMVSVPLDSAIINYRYSELHGYREGIGWGKIDEVEFMKPVPQHYLRNILKHNSDLFDTNDSLPKKKASESGMKAKLSWAFDYLLRNQEKQSSEEDRRKSTDWFAGKLEAQGFEPDRIKLVNVEILSYPNDEKFEKIIGDEEIISVGRGLK